MEADVRITTAALLLFAASFVNAQNDGLRCTYMKEIPRGETPVFEIKDFDGVPWNQQPLIPLPQREELRIEDPAFAGNSIVMTIFMEEEIEGEIAIAKLNYKGTETPSIRQPFASGSFHMLGPVIRRIPEDGGDWHLVITNKQDYEAPDMQRYSFDISVPSESAVLIVMLDIINIDDNAPIIHMIDRCEIPEPGELGRTSCVYTVTDADGRLSTEFMTYEIESDRDDADYFELVNDHTIDPDDKTTHMVLYLHKALDFELNPLHIFRVTALDSKPNTHTVTMMVQVLNVDRRNPRWLDIFAVQQFDEKTVQRFHIRAIDGDTGLDREIYYKLEADEEDTFFSLEPIAGDRSGATLVVDKIDRDTLQREVFQLSIVAYKYGIDDKEGKNPFETRANIVIIVNDVNDQRPLPFKNTYTIEIDEETPMTLNLEDFGFHDIDLGENAQYEVFLESVYPEGAEEAFMISPTRGYQEQSFIVSTRNHHLLDYEVEKYQNIQLKVRAIDLNDTRLTGEALLNINLRNWNDELPIFEHSAQTVDFDETVGKDFPVAIIKADDRDIGDKVVHSLLGNAEDYLTIDPDTGEISVAHDDYFDFHRQNEFFVQVRATDTLMEPYNSVTAQLTIRLRNINNTPPTLLLPRGSPEVEENVPQDFVIPAEIAATDPDLDAQLEFEIDWESSYATKQGRPAPDVEFHKCVEIITIPTETRHRVIGRLDVRTIREGVTIDYEEFEILYLSIKVYDRNTVAGAIDHAESILAINIIDMNDNPPVWAAGQLRQALRVREGSPAGGIIGSLLATDIDGPLYNKVRYSIHPKPGTKEGLVAIDPILGQLTVLGDGEIDADVPKTWTLEYTVIASDRCVEDDGVACTGTDPTVWNTEGDLSIDIIDTNNKNPETASPSITVWVWENATHGDPVAQLSATDLDRDELYHTVRYQILYSVNPMLLELFAVDQDSGLITVHYTSDTVLDRDGDYPEHTIFLNLFDNFFFDGDGQRNMAEKRVLVVLLDVNDNAPELPLPEELSWSVSEDEREEVRVLPHIYAPDRDEPDTDNSRVGYAILGLKVTNREIEVPELFNMIQIENKTGELETARHLKGFWGTYSIHIQAYDHGIPQQISEETYTLIIRPYNYHEPVFVFPQAGNTFRLSREQSTVNGVLVRVDGQSFPRVSATDEDGLHAGSVSFSVVGAAAEYFSMRNFEDNTGELYLSQPLPLEDDGFDITIRGSDAGTEPGSLFSEVSFRLVFVPTHGDPVFSVSQYTVAFIEKEAGLLESHQLPRAVDPKNYMCEEMNEPCHEIYYSIIDNNEEGYFQVDSTTNVISLSRELERASQASHVVRVAASNTLLDPAAPPPLLPSSTFLLTINVREADPRPVFEREIYTAGIYETDTSNRELLTVHATHTEGLDITYTMDLDTMVVDPSLEGVRESAFTLHPSSGVLSLNMNPLDTMVGMFEFDVVATDTRGAEARTDVKIYLITHLNRVYFLFNNTLDVVDSNRAFIADTFSSVFSLTCNIDAVLRAPDSSGAARDDRTEVRAHFIRNHVPATTDEIEQLRSNTILLRAIQETLLTRELHLEDFVGGSSPELGVDNSLTIYVLGALAALLGFLCVLLLITFIVRTRALNRRLEALSMTKYGSVDSGLNRVGLAAPGTNKHAVEGSNPIWNETIKAPDFDAISDVSNDSDLIGIEDLPQFRNDYFPPADDSSLRGIVLDNQNNDTVATHGNNFKFNASPFSPEFGNTPIRR
uniref:Cadherin n=2 Tax=Trichoplusia ni TaxID=7111 RepID=G0ZL60_TRINI|nr:cadherin [Trichoplusia ni]